MKKSHLLGVVCASILSFASAIVNAAPVGIYWTDIGTGTIQYSALDGSGITTLVSGLSNPQGLAVTNNYLVWTDRNDQLIRQAETDGTNINVVLNTAPGDPRGLTVTDDYIYWANTGVDSISRVNRDGSGAIDLVTTGLGFPNDIAATGTYLYWTDSGTTSIQRSNLNGTSIIDVVSGLPTTHLPTSIFVSNNYLYWATRDIALTQGGNAVFGTIQRTNLDGTGTITLVDGLIFPQQVVATSDYLYWADQNTGKVQRSNLDGTGITDIVTGLTTPVGLSVISAIPLPPALWLFGSGLLGLIGIARKKAA